MRIFFTADLHIDNRTGLESTQAVAAHLRAVATEEDVLILCGDYGNSDDKVERCLGLFAEFPGQKAGIGGNHDVWVGGSRTSLDRYRRLSDLFDKHGMHPLEEEPLVLGQTAFVGAMGWYDYSFRVPSLGYPLSAYESKQPPWAAAPIWADARFVDWGMSDPDFTAWQLERFDAQLRMVEGAAKVVAAIHHVPTERLLRPSFLPPGVPRRLSVPKKWLYANTFLGADCFSERIGRTASVDLVVCGHIHLSREARIGETRYVSIGSSYTSKELLTVTGSSLGRRSFR